MAEISIEKVKELAEEYGYSPFMMRQLIRNYPTEYEAMLKAFDRPPIETIRMNTLKADPETVSKLLTAKGFLLRQNKWIPYAYEIEQHESKIQIGATHETIQGMYYMQSLASMVPVHLLFPQPGDNVLDMCAAPGSKTTQIGQLMKQQGILVAVDEKPSRIRALKYNLRRCGVYNAVIFPYDSMMLKKVLLPNFQPNKILLDAPCSNSGLIRIEKNLKSVGSDAEINRLSKIQKGLLKVGLDILSVGGYLMYSTCSFHYQENEQVVAEVISGMKNIEIVPPYEEIGLPALKQVNNIDFGDQILNARRLDPVNNDTDAFFYCLLKKIK